MTLKKLLRRQQFTPPSMFPCEVKPEVTFYSKMQGVRKEFWERPFSADGWLMVWS